MRGEGGVIVYSTASRAITGYDNCMMTANRVITKAGWYFQENNKYGRCILELVYKVRSSN